VQGFCVEKNIKIVAVDEDGNETIKTLLFKEICLVNLTLEVGKLAMNMLKYFLTMLQFAVFC
jgi:hypothetical protein